MSWRFCSSLLWFSQTLIKFPNQVLLDDKYFISVCVCVSINYSLTTRELLWMRRGERAHCGQLISLRILTDCLWEADGGWIGFCGEASAPNVETLLIITPRMIDSSLSSGRVIEEGKLLTQVQRCSVESVSGCLQALKGSSAQYLQRLTLSLYWIFWTNLRY